MVVANEFGFPVQRVRFWTWEKRENGTIRPYQPLTEEEEKNHVKNSLFFFIQLFPCTALFLLELINCFLT